jgi:hypothetical protein
VNATEKELIVTFLRTVRRHALGQVAACDKLLEALGVAHSANTVYNNSEGQQFVSTMTQPPEFK